MDYHRRRCNSADRSRKQERNRVELSGRSDDARSAWALGGSKRTAYRPGGGSIPDRPRDPEGPQDLSDPEDRREQPSDTEITEGISREILRIHQESYGKGAGAARTFIGRDFVVVILDELELLPNEELLVRRGDQDTVLQVRARYQRVIQASFSAAIERATGRSVIGFASTTSIDKPPFVAEIFKLG